MGLGRSRLGVRVHSGKCKMGCVFGVRTGEQTLEVRADERILTTGPREIRQHVFARVNFCVRHDCVAEIVRAGLDGEASNGLPGSPASDTVRWMLRRPDVASASLMKIKRSGCIAAVQREPHASGIGEPECRVLPRCERRRECAVSGSGPRLIVGLSGGLCCGVRKNDEPCRRLGVTKRLVRPSQERGRPRGPDVGVGGQRVDLDDARERPVRLVVEPLREQRSASVGERAGSRLRHARRISKENQSERDRAITHIRAGMDKRETTRPSPYALAESVPVRAERFGMSAST